MHFQVWINQHLVLYSEYLWHVGLSHTKLPRSVTGNRSACATVRVTLMFLKAFGREAQRDGKCRFTAKLCCRQLWALFALLLVHSCNRNVVFLFPGLMTFRHISPLK